MERLTADQAFFSEQGGEHPVSELGVCKKCAFLVNIHRLAWTMDKEDSQLSSHESPAFRRILSIHFGSSNEERVYKGVSRSFVSY